MLCELNLNLGAKVKTQDYSTGKQIISTNQFTTDNMICRQSKSIFITDIAKY